MKIKIKKTIQAHVFDAPLTTEEWDYLAHTMCEDQLHSDCYQVAFDEMETFAREDNLVNILQALAEVKLAAGNEKWSSTDNLYVVFET